MTTEFLPVVDARDRVLGRASRAEVHRRGLRHRAVHLLVFHPGGRLLLQQRGWHKESNPGRWDSSVAGHVDAGEDYDACVVREAAEEIGLHLAAVPERLFKLPACAQTDQEFSWVYRTTAAGPFRLEEGEIVQARWFALAELDRWLAEEPGRIATTLRLIRARMRSHPVGA